MATNEQFYDVYNLHTGRFILRGSLTTLTLIYRWHPLAEKRLLANVAKATDMFGNGKHEDVRVVPVMSDWQPAAMPLSTGD